jgi:hypothetical protein
MINAEIHCNIVLKSFVPKVVPQLWMLPRAMDFSKSGGAEVFGRVQKISIFLLGLPLPTSTSPKRLLRVDISALERLCFLLQLSPVLSSFRSNITKYSKVLTSEQECVYWLKLLHINTSAIAHRTSPSTSCVLHCASSYICFWNPSLTPKCQHCQKGRKWFPVHRQLISKELSTPMHCLQTPTRNSSLTLSIMRVTVEKAPSPPIHFPTCVRAWTQFWSLIRAFSCPIEWDQPYGFVFT